MIQYASFQIELRWISKLMYIHVIATQNFEFNNMYAENWESNL